VIIICHIFAVSVVNSNVEMLQRLFRAMLRCENSAYSFILYKAILRSFFAYMYAVCYPP